MLRENCFSGRNHNIPMKENRSNQTPNGLPAVPGRHKSNLQREMDAPPRRLQGLPGEAPTNMTVLPRGPLQRAYRQYLAESARSHPEVRPCRRGNQLSVQVPVSLPGFLGRERTWRLFRGYIRGAANTVAFWELLQRATGIACAQSSLRKFIKQEALRRVDSEVLRFLAHGRRGARRSRPQTQTSAKSRSS